MKETIKRVSQEVSDVLKRVNEDEAIEMSKILNLATRIFVFGEGRSGLVAKAFAMRLMHGGYTVYVVGETITPSLQRDDVLVILSGSGSSVMINSLVATVKKVNAVLTIVTTNPKSVAAMESQCVVHVPAVTKNTENSEAFSIQPLGNQFDQSVHLLMDSIIIYALEKSSHLTSLDEMKKQHTNLE